MAACSGPVGSDCKKMDNWAVLETPRAEAVLCGDQESDEEAARY